MLSSLSQRERLAVKIYDETVRKGDFTDRHVRLDDFTRNVFYWIGDDDEIIDVGCRLGIWVPLLADLGVSKYFGIDPSAESINYCRRTFSCSEDPTLQFEVNEVRSLGTSYPKRFSGFVLSTVLMHIPREDVPEALLSLRKCLKDAAPGFFSTPAVTDDGEQEFVNSHGMELTLYTSDELQTLFTNAGFIFDNMLTTESGMILGHVIAV